MEAASIHCSPVSNFSAYVSPEAAAQSATTTTWGSGVTAVAFDPTRGGSVIAVVIVEGNLSLYYSFLGPEVYSSLICIVFLLPFWVLRGCIIIGSKLNSAGG